MSQMTYYSGAKLFGLFVCFFVFLLFFFGGGVGRKSWAVNSLTIFTCAEIVGSSIVEPQN